MRSGIALVLFLLAVVAVAAAVPVLWNGPAAPRQVAAADLLADGTLAPRERDLAVLGTAVRNGSLAAHRHAGSYYLPVVDVPTARAIDQASHWVRPQRQEQGKVAVVRLSLERAHTSGLSWDERLETPSSVGEFCASGAVIDAARDAGLQDFLWERFGLRSHETIVLDHGEPSFARGRAAALAAIGIALAWLAHRVWRSRLPRPAVAGTPAVRLGTLFGGIAAAAAGAIALGARWFDDAADVGRSTVRAAAAEADAAGHASRGEALLEAADTAKDFGGLGRVIASAIGTGEARITLAEGTEVFGRQPDGSWRQLAATLQLEAHRDDTGPRRHTVQHEYGPDAVDAARVRFTRRDDGELRAHIDRGAGTSLEIGVRCVVGDWQALEAGGLAELVCTGDGAQRLAEAHAADLAQRLPSGVAGRRAGVTMRAARTPRFLARRQLLVVEVGETSFALGAAAK